MNLYDVESMCLAQGPGQKTLVRFGRWIFPFGVGVHVCTIRETLIELCNITLDGRKESVQAL